jgi:hypothetical protein
MLPISELRRKIIKGQKYEPFHLFLSIFCQQKLKIIKANRKIADKIKAQSRFIEVNKLLKS